jgi:ankyrin repeat protein
LSRYENTEKLSPVDEAYSTGDPDTPFEFFRSAPFKTIVKALLLRGFDINTTGGRFGTALTAAIVSDNLDIARFLLKKGIDPNAPGGMYSGALQAAAASCQTREEEEP